MAMSESQRGMIASQVWQMRSLEQSGDYLATEWNRGKLDYFKAFNGLSKLFEYARELNNQSTVLDIGAGTTRGAAEISQSRVGQGLSFMATVLTMRREIKGNLGLENTRITPAEILRGIENSSVAAVLSLNAIAYSVEPGIVAQRLNEVLIPGGVIKAVFRSKVVEPSARGLELGFNTHDKFSQELEALGYDVAVLNQQLQLEQGRPAAVGANEDVMLAIKPGGKLDVTAKQLLGIDSAMIDIIMAMDGHY